jgi:hypothetical protein
VEREKELMERRKGPLANQSTRHARRKEKYSNRAKDKGQGIQITIPDFFFLSVWWSSSKFGGYAKEWRRRIRVERR